MFGPLCVSWGLSLFFFHLYPFEQLYLFPFVLCPVDSHPKQTAVQLHRSRSVIVARHWIRDKAWVTVRVKDAHGRNVDLGSIAYARVCLEDTVLCAEENDEVGKAHSACASIGQHTSLPVPGMSIFAALLGCSFDQVRELAPATYKKYDTTAVSNMCCKVESLL